MLGTQRQKIVGLPPFRPDITKLNSIRKTNHGRCIQESYDLVRSLSVHVVKSISNQQMYYSNETFVLHSNFEMETDHVVSRMIFHAITADQNARIRVYCTGEQAGQRKIGFFPPKSPPGGRGQLCLRSYASAHPMILAIITSLLSRPVILQWPLKSDTRKVFHPMIAQRI